MVSAAQRVTTTELHTTPAYVDVNAAGNDTWAVAFADALQAGESLSSAAATIKEIRPGSGGDAVASFVTSATVSGTSVNVVWDATVLSPGQVYRLTTTATLNTGAVLVALTDVYCIG